MNQRALQVVQLLPALGGGGVERGTVDVANALVAAGHRSTVISAGGPMVAELVGTTHLTLPVGKKRLTTLALVPKLRRLWTEERPDIVHARSRVPAWIAWLAWRGMPKECRPRFITTAHGFYSVSRYSAVMARGERVIAVSESIRDYLLANYPHCVGADRIDLIYRGVDRSAHHPNFRPDASWLEAWAAELPHLAGRRLVVLPARLTRLKGHLAFVEIIARLRASGLDVQGLIVGGVDPDRRSYAEEVRAAVATAGLTDRIDFLGHRTDLREILATCDVSLSLSSKPESFGRTVAEALYLGRPVVGFAHGGVAEILRAMYPSGAVPVHDLDAAVGAIADALAAHRPITPVDEFDLQNMLQRTLESYQRVAVR